MVRISRLNSMEEAMEEQFVTEDMLTWAEDRLVARNFLRRLDDKKKLCTEELWVLLQVYDWFEQDPSLEARMIKIKCVRLYEYHKQKTSQVEKSVSEAA